MSELTELKFLFKDPTVLSLIFVNLFTIFLAVAQQLSFGFIVWVYWLQSVSIGFFNFLRILSLKDFSTKGFRIDNRPVKTTQSARVFTAFFFAFHYGFFHLGYAIFLLNFPFLPFHISFSEIVSALPVGALFFANHLISFIFYSRKPQPRKNIGKVMFYPYVRILPMHFVVFCSPFFCHAVDALIVVFLFLKTVADVLMHSIEHKSQLP